MLARRPKVAEVAAMAGVSTATVDRVMNGRGGVHERTVARVEQAIQQIMGTSHIATAVRIAGSPIHVVLAGDESQVTKDLSDELSREAERLGAEVETAFVERMNPAALADKLNEIAEAGSAGVVVQSLDHALVREAFDYLDRRGIPVITVLTDMAGVRRRAYVGLDNRAAGRTAGYIMGRFCHGPGKIAVVWGGQLYRSHEERESGFRNVLRTERPDLQCLEVITGGDDPEMTHARVRKALAEHVKLSGIYCVGGGVLGAVRAIDEAGLSRSLVMIAHNFNSLSKPHILSGTIDAVIHQDTKRIASSAMVQLLAADRDEREPGIPIEIVTRENMMHR